MISKQEMQLSQEKKAFITAFNKLETLPFINKLPKIKETSKIEELYELLLKYGFSIDLKNNAYSNALNVSIKHFATLYLEGFFLLLYLDATETIKQFVLHSHEDDKKYIIDSSIQFGAVNTFKAVAHVAQSSLTATEYLITVCQSLCYLLHLDEKKQLNANARLVGSKEDFIIRIKKYQQVVEFLNGFGADPLLSDLDDQFRINYNPFANSEVVNYMTVNTFVKFVCSKTVESEVLTLMQMVDSQAFHQYAENIPFAYTKIEDNHVEESEGSLDHGYSDILSAVSARASNFGMYSSRDKLLVGSGSESSWDDERKYNKAMGL